MNWQAARPKEDRSGRRKTRTLVSAETVTSRYGVSTNTEVPSATRFLCGASARRSGNTGEEVTAHPPPTRQLADF
jgi:hypothetical protein